MKIAAKIIVGVGIACLAFGIILVSVAMLTGGGLTSIASHGIVPQYISGPREQIISLFAQTRLLLSELAGNIF